MFNRRQLLIGTVATAAVASFPASAAVLSNQNTVLDSVLKFIAPNPRWNNERYYGCSKDELSHTVDVQINTRLITHYPELFPEERHLFSGCPGNLFFNGKERIAACVGSRRWAIDSAYIDIDLMQDLKCVNYDSATKYVNEIADKVAGHIRHKQDRLAEHDNHMFSLIPAISNRRHRIDPWWEPAGLNHFHRECFVFRSRYAVLSKDYRIMTAEEDQKLWMGE